MERNCVIFLWYGEVPISTSDLHDDRQSRDGSRSGWGGRWGRERYSFAYIIRKETFSWNDDDVYSSAPETAFKTARSFPRCEAGTDTVLSNYLSKPHKVAWLASFITTNARAVHDDLDSIGNRLAYQVHLHTVRRLL